MKPGTYSLRISFVDKRKGDTSYSPMEKVLTSNELIYRFTIRPAWYQTTWFGVIVGMISGLLLMLIISMIYRGRQRSRQKQKDLQHRMGVLQLQSYRAQLNPHFVFNALSSIQSLINKDDAASANQYLTDFSSLLRITLDQHKAEFWTLQDETDMLTKYIGLEQLRFHFRYNLNIDGTINAIDISFPSMLLQPIVENAIKHGISSKTTEGQLTIDIRASRKDLIITISDNGAGFATDATHTGIHGISLTQQRIAFLNETNSNQRIKLNIQSSDAGTNATFYLYDHL